jgi:hypothetical protein
VKRSLFASITIAALLVAPVGARADTALMVTTGNHLLTFDTAAPSSILADVAVTGIGPDETIKGIDFRPATGQLYAFTVPTATSGDTIRTYTLDRTTGVAGFVGVSTALSVADVASGVSFDPVTDRARYVNSDDRNARIRPVDGTSPGSSPPAAAGDRNFGLIGPNPDLIAVAYDRSFQGATLSTAYAIDRTDSRLDILGGIDGYPPATIGEIYPVGPLGPALKPTADGGFDISFDGRAFAALTGADDRTQLYSVNLATGAATVVGSIGSGNAPAASLALVPGTEPPAVAGPDRKRPTGLLDIPSSLRLRKLRLPFFASEACRVTARLVVGKTTVARGSASLTKARVIKLRLRSTARGRKLFKRRHRARAKLTITLTDRAGNVGRVRRSLTLRR